MRRMSYLLLGFLPVLGCTAKGPPDADVRSEGVHQLADDAGVEIARALSTPLDLSALPPIRVCRDMRPRDTDMLECPPDTTDADLERIGDLPNLFILGLASTQVTDVGLQELVGLNLVSLDLRGTRVSDGGLAALVGQARLGDLWLSGTDVTDAGLEHLAKLAQLQNLELRGLQVSDAGLAHLAGSTNLVTLDLQGTRVSDAGLESLAGLERLEELDLRGTQVAGPGMRYLTELKRLSAIDLSDSWVTDAHLEYFIGLAKLQELRLDGTRVTRKGAVRLARYLLDCRIYYGRGNEQQGVAGIAKESGNVEILEFTDEFDDVAIFGRTERSE